MAFNASPLRAVQFTDRTDAGDGGMPVDVSCYTNLTFYVSGDGTIDGGVVTFYEADFDAQKDGAYGGTWSAIGTANAVDVTGGAQLAYHCGGSGGAFAYGYVRAEITTDVTGGGTLSVVLRAC